VAGVCLEYIPKLAAFIGTPTWEAFRDLSGGLLIALGVVVELTFSSMSAKKRDQLRRRHVERVAELTLIAEEERSERIRIERYMAGRDLTPQQVEMLQTRLSDVGIRLRTYVAVAVDAEEAKRFSGHICTGLRACNWDVFACGESPVDRFPMPGLIVFATPDQASQQAAGAVTGALMEIGVTCLMFSADVETGERYWPPGLYNRGESAVLIVVNEAQLLDS
jgi:hypothetical protein